MCNILNRRRNKILHANTSQWENSIDRKKQQSLMQNEAEVALFGGGGALRGSWRGMSNCGG